MSKEEPLLGNDADSGHISDRNTQMRGNVYALQMFLLTTFLLLFMAGSVFHPKPLGLRSTEHHKDDKKYDCNITLVESIPIGMKFKPNSPSFISTFDAWQWLLNNSKSTVDIGSYYWTLRGEDTGLNHSSAQPGEHIFKQLLAIGTNEKQDIKIRIAQSVSSKVSPNLDTQILASYGAAQVVSLDFAKYLGGGILHTKLWIVDGQHFYLGSANMDWRALTQVKELGVLAQNCPSLTSDLAKIFKAYWYLGTHPSNGIPSSWSWDYITNYNLKQPMLLNINNSYTMQAFASSAPPPLSAVGRTDDLDAILNTINTAIKFIHIAVMDYYPLIIYGPKVQYWPVIDNALRTAAVERGVSVKLLISWWKHTDASEINYLRSLQDLSMEKNNIDIQIRRFIVPADEDQEKIPYGRVNHNKYMVTDGVAYIGTSNWSGDYFTNTAGIGLVLKDTLPNMATSIRKDLQSVFERDWTSEYAHNLV